MVYKCNPPDYTCNLVDYTCNPPDYTCKLLNFRFTTPILITVLDTVEVTPFFSKIFPLVLRCVICVICQITCVICWITCVIWQITLVKYLISGLQLLFCGSNGYCNTNDSGGSNVHVGLHM